MNELKPFDILKIMEERRIMLEDDIREPPVKLIEHRLPWLLLGLLVGAATTILSSTFDKLLSSKIVLVYFIPVIVYMADAVGTQTETIYIRRLAKGPVKFTIYLFKEFLAGVALGILFSFVLGLFAYFWFGALDTAIIVALAMFANVAIAPVTAIIIPQILQKERTDPALGAGPFTTGVQDLISLLIYFIIASVILLN